MTIEVTCKAEKFDVWIRGLWFENPLVLHERKFHIDNTDPRGMSS